MSRYIKTDDDLFPYSQHDAKLPEIVIVNSTAQKGVKGIKNHMTPIQEMHAKGSRTPEIEYAVLFDIKKQAEKLAELIKGRLKEIKEKYGDRR